MGPDRDSGPGRKTQRRQPDRSTSTSTGVTNSPYQHLDEQGETTMALGFSVWLFLLGVLGASNLIIAKKPDAKELIAKLAPYQGWMGAGAAITGLYWLVMAVLWIGTLGSNPIGWIMHVAVAAILFSLGLLLGVGTLKTFIKHPQAVEKMDLLITKLAPKQGVLGLIAIGLSIASIVVNVIF
jgi:hypothetical protein